MIRMGKSIRHKWVKDDTHMNWSDHTKDLFCGPYLFSAIDDDINEIAFVPSEYPPSVLKYATFDHLSLFA